MTNLIPQYEFNDVCAGGNDRAIEIKENFKDGRCATTRIPVLRMGYGKAHDVVEFFRKTFNHVIIMDERVQYEQNVERCRDALRRIKLGVKLQEDRLAEAVKDLEEFDKNNEALRKD